MSRRNTAESEYTYQDPSGAGEVQPGETKPEESPEFDVNAAAQESMPEEMPDLDELASEPSVGAWPNGWYVGEVLEGYATRSGKQFETSDAPSKDGNSRNVLLAVKLTNSAGEDRNNFYRINYREDDFESSVLEAISEARKEFAGQKQWPGEAKALQSRSLAVGRIGQIQKAFGFKFKRTGEGFLNPLPYVGQKADFRLRTNDDGFNEVTEVAKLGDRTKKQGRRGRK